MSFFYPTNKRLLGVYCSGSSIQIVDVSKRSSGFFLEECAVFHVTESVEAFYSFCLEQNWAKRRGVLAISDEKIYRKIVPIHTSLAEKNIEKWVSMEVGQLLSDETIAPYFDFQIIKPPFIDQDLSHMIVLAARKADVEFGLHLFQRGGLRSIAVDVASQAFYRLLKQAKAILLDTIAWIGMDRNQFCFYVYYQGVTIFSHTKNWRVDDLNESHMVWVEVKQVIQLFQMAHPKYSLQSVFASVYSVDWDGLHGAKQIGIDIQFIHLFEGLSFAKHLHQDDLISHGLSLFIAIGSALRI